MGGITVTAVTPLQAMVGSLLGWGQGAYVFILLSNYNCHSRKLDEEWRCWLSTLLPAAVDSLNAPDGKYKLNSHTAEGEIIFIESRISSPPTTTTTSSRAEKPTTRPSGGGDEEDDTWSLAQRTSATWRHMVQVHHTGRFKPFRGVAVWCRNRLISGPGANGDICGAPGRTSERTKVKDCFPFLLVSESHSVFIFRVHRHFSTTLHRNQLSIKQQGKDFLEP